MSRKPKEESLQIDAENRCPKCSGAGWCWGYELDDYDVPENQMHDDTQYTCDVCQGTGKSPKKTLEE